MKIEIQKFTSDVFGEIRTCQVNNQIMFVGKDVATALGYSNSRDALSRHVDAEDKGTVVIHDTAYTTRVTFINESGLYALILSSKLPQAKAFKRWVTSGVLPAIRSNGRYELQPHEIKLLGEKADYCDSVLMSVDCMTTTQVANEMGMSAQELYRILLVQHVLYWQSGSYLLYVDYAREHLAKTRTVCRCNRLGIYHTRCYPVWNEKGRKRLHEEVEKYRKRQVKEVFG